MQEEIALSLGHYKRYDWRLRNLVATTGKIDDFFHLGIPKSTLRSWIKKGPIKVISLPQLDRSENELVNENLILKKKLARAESQFTLLKSTIRIFGFQIQYHASRVHRTKKISLAQFGKPGNSYLS